MERAKDKNQPVVMIYLHVFAYTKHQPLEHSHVAQDEGTNICPLNHTMPHYGFKATL